VQRTAHGPNNLSGPSSGQPRRPSSELPPRSRARRRTTRSPPCLRAGRPFGRISTSLEGWTPPRANLHLARWLNAPSGESPPRSRSPRARGTRAHSLDQSIKCSGTTLVPGSKANPRHAGPLTPPGNRIPALFRQPSPCYHPRHCRGTVREGRCQLCDTVPPTPVQPARRAPRKRTTEPRKGYKRLPSARTGRRRDVELVECVSSANSGPVRPSPPLYCHPEHCSTIPGAVGAQDDKTSPHPLLRDLQPSVIPTLELTYGR
jgi:hypothetical protein